MNQLIAGSTKFEQVVKMDSFPEFLSTCVQSNTVVLQWIILWSLIMFTLHSQCQKILSLYFLIRLLQAVLLSKIDEEKDTRTLKFSS